MTSQTKTKICHVSYSRLVTCRKRRDSETCNCGRGRQRGCRMADGRNMDSKFRDSHITGKHSSFEDGAMKANTLMSPRGAHGRAAVSKAMQRTRVSVGSVTTAAAKCVRSDRDHYRIIVSYRLSR